MGARFNALRDRVGAKIADFALSRICTPVHGEVLARAIRYGISMAHEEVQGELSEKYADAVGSVRIDGAPEVIAYVQTHPSNVGWLVHVPDLGMMAGFSGEFDGIANAVEATISTLTGAPRDDIKVRVVRTGE